MKNKQFRRPNEKKPAPLWKKLVIVMLIVAMPLFFWFIRNIQMQQALTSSEPEQATEPMQHEPSPD